MSKNLKDSATTDKHSTGFLVYLMLTAMISGALVMVVEVLGSRVIGPFFGVSLFIWTSLIAVTLISLSLGYAAGGHLADRRGSPEYLFGILIVAGMAVLLIPLLKGLVLELCVPLGLRLGTFVSTSLLFGPALFLLGCVSPYLIKIAARELHNIGSTVGGFYAVSTVGSVIGTVITGFVLIAYLSVDAIFYLVSGLLVLLGLSYFLIFRRLWQLSPLALLPLILLWLPNPFPEAEMLQDGTRSELIASNDSYYGSLKIVDYSYRERHTRELVIDGMTQGGVDMQGGSSIYAYSYFMALLPWALKEEMSNALVIGMGAGVVPKWFAEQGIKTDVVDIDPQVFHFARDYMGVEVNGRMFVEDARYFLQQSSDRYDVVVLDVFNGDTTPAHLLSLEALRLINQRLNEGGILAVNLMGNIQGETFMTASVVKTLEQIFDQVLIYPTTDSTWHEGSGNLALIAYQGTPRKPDYRRLSSFKISDYARKDVHSNLGRSFRFPEKTRAIILTDDYNPIDFYDADLRESVRTNILKNTPWEILLFSG